MIKNILIALLFLICCPMSAQIEGNLLLGLTPGTTAEISSTSNPVTGSLIYNSEEGKMYMYNGSAFVKIPSLDTNSIDFWNSTGNAGIDPILHFLGTTDTQDMVFKANGEERLRLSGTNQTVRINGALQFNNHPFIIRANGNDLMALQTAAGATEWHWNLLGNGLNFVETGVADYRIFMEQGGNIGIDTGTPSEKLDVNGNLRVRNITTTISDLDVLVTTATGVVQKRAFADFTGSLGTDSQTLSTDGTPGDISITGGNDITIAVVSTDTDNSISTGTDGGAYLKVYEKIVIWAEESAALANNQDEWSYGNGATGNIGIPLPEAWEAYAISFNSDVNGAANTAEIAVRDTNTNTTLFTFTASGNANNMVYTEILATPVSIPVGTSIGFRTITEVGNISDARVAVFLRRLPN